jgi:AAA family ATP:ADP antiporter
MNRAVDLELEEVSDSTTRETMLKTMTSLHIDPDLMKQMRGQVEKPSAEAGTSRAPVARTADLKDPLVNTILELRSGDPLRIRTLLERESSLDPATAPLVIRLLAWDEVAEQAVRALARIGPRITGQLADGLLDPDEEFAIRRRVPRVLVEFSTDRAARALFSGLTDKRFEVRFQCGRALARLQSGGLPMPLTSDEVYLAVLNEVKVDRRVWVGRRLLERGDDSRESMFVDEVLRDRANRSLEHVFTILSLTLPQEPLKVAFRGLHTSDQALRGTALEYLESVLPGQVRRSLWPFLEVKLVSRPAYRSRYQILNELLKSNDSIQINLKELRKRTSEDTE